MWCVVSGCVCGLPCLCRVCLVACANTRKTTAALVAKAVAKIGKPPQIRPLRCPLPGLSQQGWMDAAREGEIDGPLRCGLLLVRLLVLVLLLPQRDMKLGTAGA